jgi:hypothetical protein
MYILVACLACALTQTHGDASPAQGTAMWQTDKTGTGVQDTHSVVYSCSSAGYVALLVILLALELGSLAYTALTLLSRLDCRHLPNTSTQRLNRLARSRHSHRIDRRVQRHSALAGSLPGHPNPSHPATQSSSGRTTLQQS